MRFRTGAGKSDPLDAAAIAAAVLPLEEERLRIPRQDEGVRAALRVLVTAREQMSAERTAKVNALAALARTVDVGMDARRPLSGAPVAEISRWREREEEIATATARTEAVRLANRITALDAELKANHDRVRELVKASPAAPLLEETGVGPVTAAVAYIAWSHLGRVRSEAAFAALAGVSPITASSGNWPRAFSSWARLTLQSSAVTSRRPPWGRWRRLRPSLPWSVPRAGHVPVGRRRR